MDDRHEIIFWVKQFASKNFLLQIYVLRKQKNTDREYRFLPDYEKNPVYLDVVEHLFNTVRAHLTSSWEGGVSYGLQRGYLL